VKNTRSVQPVKSHAFP